jgi:hypothetical protein
MMVRKHLWMVLANLACLGFFAGSGPVRSISSSRVESKSSEKQVVARPNSNVHIPPTSTIASTRILSPSRSFFAHKSRQ